MSLIPDHVKDAERLAIYKAWIDTEYAILNNKQDEVDPDVLENHLSTAFVTETSLQSHFGAFKSRPSASRFRNLLVAMLVWQNVEHSTL